MDIRTGLKQLLERSGISVRQLSLKSGVRRQSIMQFLSGGNIHINNLEKIAAALGYKFCLSKAGTTSLLDKRLDINKIGLRKFCKDSGIIFLAVFGSVLRSDFDKKSDIDVIVKFKKPVSFFELAEIEDGLKKLFKTSHNLDLVTQNGVSPLIEEEINKTREVLYEEAA